MTDELAALRARVAELEAQRTGVDDFRLMLARLVHRLRQRPDLSAEKMIEQAADLLSRKGAASILRSTPDPECPYCEGSGERFWHAPDCRSDDCALAGGIYDCNGVVEPCPCAAPTPDPRDARIAVLEAALREIRSKSGDQWSIDTADRALGDDHG